MLFRLSLQLCHTAPRRLQLMARLLQRVVQIGLMVDRVDELRTQHRNFVAEVWVAVGAC